MNTVTDFDPRVAGILRMLIYPIQFEADPLDGIDRVVAEVVDAEHLKLPLLDILPRLIPVWPATPGFLN